MRQARSGAGAGGRRPPTIPLIPAIRPSSAIRRTAAAPIRAPPARACTKPLMPDAARKPPAQTQQQEPVFKPTSELIGMWKGAVHTYKEEIPFTIEIKPDGDIHTRMANQLRTLLNRVDFKDGYLTGQMMSDIG